MENLFQFTVQFRVQEGMEDLEKWLPAKLSRAVPKRQSEFLAGRYCASRALAAAGWGGNPELIFSHTGASPDWPNEFAGSITHSGVYASAAVVKRSHFRSVGRDTENITRRAFSQVGPAIATDSELRSFPNDLPLIFSGKESVYKCLHPLVKQFFDFGDVEVFKIESDKFYFRLLKDLHQDFQIGQELSGHFKREGSLIHTLVLI